MMDATLFSIPMSGVFGSIYFLKVALYRTLYHHINQSKILKRICRWFIISVIGVWALILFILGYMYGAKRCLALAQSFFE